MFKGRMICSGSKSEARAPEVCKITEEADGTLDERKVFHIVDLWLVIFS
jgi:hypothetical protein